MARSYVTVDELKYLQVENEGRAFNTGIIELKQKEASNLAILVEENTLE